MCACVNSVFLTGDQAQCGSCRQAVCADGIPKGMKAILEEKKINTATLRADDMRTILQNHDDFRSEKTMVKTFLINRGHTLGNVHSQVPL